jgi:multicomponent Na+:H+ antiporter subunit A
LSEYFGAQSLAAAHGRNVVNVIIVDFRGLDTLGEIAVVLLAALAAGGILRRMGRAGR